MPLDISCIKSCESPSDYLFVAFPGFISILFMVALVYILTCHDTTIFSINTALSQIVRFLPNLRYLGSAGASPSPLGHTLVSWKQNRLSFPNRVMRQRDSTPQSAFTAAAIVRPSSTHFSMSSGFGCHFARTPSAAFVIPHTAICSSISFTASPLHP